LASWDVFHGDRLELERGLSTAAIREALVRGELRDDDLIRPAGTTVAWARLTEIPELLGPAETPSPPQSAAQPPPPTSSGSARPVHPDLDPADFEVQTEARGERPPAHGARTIRPPDWRELRTEPDDVSFPVIQDQTAEPRTLARSPTPAETPPAPAWAWGDEDDDLDDQIEVDDELGSSGLEILDDDLDLGSPADPDREPGSESRSSRVALPVITARGWDDTGSEVEADEEGDFTLSRSGPMTVEELDLAPMVDVAFQLVLFFMVTATTVLYKTLEIPKPTTEKAPSAVVQGRSRTLDDYKDDYIIVEIDPSGAMKIDREPVAAEMNALVERLRTAREKTGRKAMLLSADYATKHRHSVLAYDAANEIGLVPVIARPARPQGPGPNPFAAPPPVAPPRAANPPN
jgi:biopolymer transport protein ExbD